MGKPRVFTHPDTQSGVYHVVSRIGDRQFRFGELEKDAFARMMKAFAALHQIEILTYCLMGNHFHLLIRPPAHERSGKNHASRSQCQSPVAAGTGTRSAP